jgi:hypothetical protein
MAHKKRDIPRSNSYFNTWQQNFVSKIVANPADFGLSPAEASELQDAFSDWNSHYSEHITAHNEAKKARELKDSAKNRLESVSRILKKKIQADPGVANTKRELLDITVTDKIRTPLSERIIQDTTPPVIQALCTAPKTVRISWYPSQVGTDSEALPEGIDAVAIWVAFGGIPADNSIWRFLAMDTKSPYVHNVENNTTVTLAYKAQWVDRKKRMGPFGDPVIVAVTP